MADNQLVVNVLLKLQDEVSQGIKATLDKSSGYLESFGQKVDKVGAGLESIGKRVGGIGGAVQLGLSRLDLDMASVARNSVEAEKALYSVATTAGKSGAEARASVQEWAAAVNQISVATNKSQGEVISAFQDLVSKGISDADAIRMLEPIGKAATAAGAQIRDIASAANASFQNLGIAPDQLSKALDIMAAAGKKGAFELRDMAQYFDALTVKSALLGDRGEKALGSLAAAAQIARKGAGDASTAANNLANFLDKLSAPVTARAFEKFGLNLAEEVKKGLASGDLIGYMGEQIQRVTQGDASKVSQLFADVQAKNFIAPLIQNLEEYKRIRDQALSSSGVVDEDFKTAMQSMAAVLNKLQIAGQAAIGQSDVIKGLLAGLKDLADWAAAHPDVIAMLGIGSAAAAVGGGVLLGVGAVLRSISTIVTALSGLTAFLAANPIVLTVLGVTALATASAYAGFKFGEFINEQISKAAEALTGVKGATLGTALADLTDWIAEKAQEIPKAIGKAFTDTIKFLKDLPRQFIDIGKNIIQGLLDGIKAKATEVVDATKKLGSDALQAIKDLLRIRSPSEAMAEIGEQTVAGYVEGLYRGMPQVQDGIAQMASLVQFGAAYGQTLGAANDGGFGGGAVDDGRAAYYAQVEAAETQHQQNIFSIRTFFESQSLANATRYRQLNLDSMGFFMGQLGALMQTKSKAMFQIGKAGAIGEAIIETYLAAQRAYAAMAGIPIVGPALAAAAAASAIAVGMARVQAIKSTQYGGVSGSPVLASGGASGPVVPKGSATVPFDQATNGQGTPAPAPRVVNITINGRFLDAQTVRDELIPQLNEAAGDGVVINVRQAA